VNAKVAIVIKGDDFKDCVSALKPQISDTIKCPCIDCIVKMVCSSGLSCEKFARYYTHIIADRKIKWKRCRWMPN